MPRLELVALIGNGLLAIQRVVVQINREAELDLKRFAKTLVVVSVDQPMSLSHLALFLISLIAAPASKPAPQTQAFIGATLLNPGQPALPDAVVLVRNAKIVASGSRADVKIPAGAKRFELAGKWIMPGLIDAHVHFFQSGGVYTRPDKIDLRSYRSYEEEQRLIRENLPDTFARYLRAGITSVIDMGGPNTNFEVRAIANQTAAAPRVLLTGPLLTPGPIKNFRTGKSHFLTEGSDPAVRHDMTPDEARAEVRRQAGLKADFIKVWVSGDKTTETQRAIYDESKRLGLKVAVHARTLAQATEAVASGADILVHNVVDAPMPDSLFAEMKRRDVILIPTLIVDRGYTMIDNRRFAFEAWEYRRANPYVMGTFFDLLHVAMNLSKKEFKMIREAKVWQPGQIALDNVRRMVRAGVTVAAGSDSGNPGTFHGASLLTELKLMSRAGLTNAEVLESVTVNGARVLGMEMQFGSIAAGKVADLLILDADPLANLENLEHVHRVVKGGHVFDPAQLIVESPQDLVQRQLNAYNARDIEAFLATYAPDVVIQTLPQGPTAPTGLEFIRQRWGAQFKNKPDAAVRILHRIVQGSFVIDQEQFVHRWDLSQQSLAGTAVYEVQNGLIDRVWFLKEPTPAAVK